MIRNLNKTKLFFILFIAIIECFYCQLTFTYGQFNKFVIPVMVINGLLFWIFLVKNKDGLEKKIGIIICLSYIVRCGILIGKMYGLQTPLSGLDDHAFYQYVVGESKVAFAYPQIVKNILVPFIGKSRYVLEYQNILLSIVTIFVMKKTLYLINEDNTNNNKIFIPLLIFAFSPINICVSTSFLRETTMILLNVLSLYYFILWYKKQGLLYFALACFFNCCSAYLHSGMLFGSIAYGLIFLFYNFKTNRVSIHTRGLTNLIIAGILVAIAFALFGNSILFYFQKYKDFDEVSTRTAVGNTDYLTFLDGKPFIVTLLFLPLKIIYFYLSPMPWNCYNIQTLITFLFNSCLFLYLFITIMKKKSDDKYLTRLLLFVLLSLSIVHATGVKNAGTALRHREKMMPIFIVLYSLALNNEDDHKKAYTYKYEDKRRITNKKI